jgi:hypothetical protein
MTEIMSRADSWIRKEIEIFTHNLKPATVASVDTSTLNGRSWCPLFAEVFIIARFQESGLFVKLTVIVCHDFSC